MSSIAVVVGSLRIKPVANFLLLMYMYMYFKIISCIHACKASNHCDISKYSIRFLWSTLDLYKKLIHVP